MRSFVSAAAKRRSLAIFVAFFLSGGSSLIFQTIWTRYLHHVFGATTVAISTVLTVFMAGLGLGAWLGGRYADRIRHPIITYAIAEVCVGVWGLLIPYLVRSDGWLAVVNAWLRGTLGSDSGLFMIARFLCVAPILILPATLMGSSLPLLTRHFVNVREGAREAGARAGVLYALNTFGAATGPILSAFVLLPTVGQEITNIVACSMNFTLAALIWFSRDGLLHGQWKRGEPLRFWPEKAKAAPEKEAAPTPAVRPRPEKQAPPKVEKDAAKASAGKKKKTKKKPAAKKAAAASSTIPELARKAALIAFAASGAASLAYEVVWSRALAMTVGSSIYSFALILATFLIGIAGGSAAMSAFMGRRATPYVGLAVTSLALIILANVPWALDMVDPEHQQRRFEGSAASFLLLCLLYSGPVLLALVWSQLNAPREGRKRVSFSEIDWRPLVTILMAAMPVIAAAVNTWRFPGFLPKIILSVVAAIAVIAVLGSLLSRVPTLLLALVQLVGIAGATVVSYVWQDEIPRAFAQLVITISPQALPDHVGAVKIFMWLTVMLCTLPSTLGMGAMFPLTVRIWTTGGAHIARDVATVYTGNTIGSILGAWLPGFVLFALIGAERTLHLAIYLNMFLALMMLIAGVADPTERQDFWSWRRLLAIGLPIVAGLFLGFSCYQQQPDDWRWWMRLVGAVGFGALSVLEYTWLKRRSQGETTDGGIALAMIAVPLVVGIAIATLMVAPQTNDPWALGVVYTTLRAFLVAVVACTAWANYREHYGALAPVLGSATGGTR